MKTVNILFAALLSVYIYFYFSLYPAPLFSPLFAGNDARQQLFPLYTSIYPGIFEDDLIYKSMKAYLAPLHLGLSLAVTKLTHSPILSGHVVMIIQMLLTVIFLFLAVRKVSSTAAACLSVAWLFNSPNLIRNFYGGLPRSWAGVVIASFLYFLITGNHKAIILIFFLACLLHPHSTFLIIVCYALYLAFEFLFSKKRPTIQKPLVSFIFFSPLIFCTAYFVVQRPAEIGTMVSYQEAINMPAFTQGGRFPFLPFNEPLDEIKRVGFRAFYNIWGENRQVPDLIFYSVILIYSLILIFQFFTKKQIIRKEFIIFICAVFICYYLARLFAFRLYLPVRYINWPMGLFFIMTLPAAFWQLATISKNKTQYFYAASALTALILILYQLNGSGLGGRTNFKPGRHFNSPLYAWLRSNTPDNALIAGHPTQLDGVQLYAIRRAFITTETAHPFYDLYSQEADRRIEISFKALFSRSLQEFLDLNKAEGITHFVFGKNYFLARRDGSGRLRNQRYFRPHDELLSSLAAYPADDYLYFELMRDSDLSRAVVFDEQDSFVVDMEKLDAALAENRS